MASADDRKHCYSNATWHELTCGHAVFSKGKTPCASNCFFPQEIAGEHQFICRICRSQADLSIIRAVQHLGGRIYPYDPIENPPGDKERKEQRGKQRRKRQQQQELVTLHDTRLSNDDVPKMVDKMMGRKIWIVYKPLREGDLVGHNVLWCMVLDTSFQRYMAEVKTGFTLWEPLGAEEADARLRKLVKTERTARAEVAARNKKAKATKVELSPTSEEVSVAEVEMAAREEKEQGRTSRDISRENDNDSSGDGDNSDDDNDGDDDEEEKEKEEVVVVEVEDEYAVDEDATEKDDNNSDKEEGPKQQQTPRPDLDGASEARNHGDQNSRAKHNEIMSDHTERGSPVPIASEEQRIDEAPKHRRRRRKHRSTEDKGASYREGSHRRHKHRRESRSRSRSAGSEADEPHRLRRRRRRHRAREAEVGTKPFRREKPKSRQDSGDETNHRTIWLELRRLAHANRS